MNTRRVLRLNSALQLVALLATLALVNVFAADHFARLDLTRDREHTLSQAGRHLMGRLDKPLLVKVWFTGGLEAPYNNHEQILLDKLQELRAWSGGRMDVQVVDPTGDVAAEAEAHQYGVAPIQYRFQSSQRSELRQVYMGLAMLYGDRQEVLPAVTRVGTIEYDLARAVKALLDGRERKTVGFLVGHQEVDLSTAGGPVETLRGQLAENFDLAPVQLGGAEGVPEEIDLLLVVGPRRPVSLREQYQLDQYLMSGRPMALFLSNFRPDMKNLRANPVVHGLEAWLGNAGIRLNRDLVIDRVSNGQLNFPVRQGRYVIQQPVNYPLIPQTRDLADHLAVQGLDTMLFPFASSIDVAADLPPELTVTALVRASGDAVRARGVTRVAPAVLAQPLDGEAQGPWTLAVAANGIFGSFFAGREVPPAPGGETDPPAITESAPNRLVVVGSSDMIANNLTFVQNLVDWMVQDQALIEIRSKAAQVPTLEAMTPAQITGARLINLLVPGGLLLLLGALRAASRRRTGAPER